MSDRTSRAAARAAAPAAAGAMPDAREWEAAAERMLALEEALEAASLELASIKARLERLEAPSLASPSATPTQPADIVAYITISLYAATLLRDLYLQSPLIWWVGHRP